jgi:hypothetical protein
MKNEEKVICLCYHCHQEIGVMMGKIVHIEEKAFFVHRFCANGFILQNESLQVN